MNWTLMVWPLMVWSVMLLALGLLWARRVHVVVMLAAAQVLVVAAAAAQPITGSIHAIAGLAVCWVLYRSAGWFSLPPIAPPIGGGLFVVTLGGAALLPALMFEPISGALFVVVAGLAMLATRRHPVAQAAALLELHSGSGMLSAEAALPVLPCLALLGLWARSRPSLLAAKRGVA
jgi:hypothetical protein